MTGPDLPIQQTQLRLMTANGRPVRPALLERAVTALREFAIFAGLADQDAARSYEAAYGLRRAAYAEWRRAHCPSAPSESAINRWYRRWAEALFAAGLASSNEPPAHPPRYDDEEIVASIRTAAGEVGDRPLTVDEYDAWVKASAKPTPPPLRYVWDRFGSWTGALSAAGLLVNETKEPDGAMMPFEFIRELGSDAPTPEPYLQWSARHDVAAPSVRALVQDHGSWRNAVQAAGGTPPPQNPSGRVWENGEILAALRQWSEHSPSEVVMTTGRYRGWRRDHDTRTPADPVIARRFGSWKAALVAAGIETAENHLDVFRSLEPGAAERALRAFTRSVPDPARWTEYRYEEWRGADAHWAPGSTTLCTHFSNWGAVQNHMASLV